MDKVKTQSWQDKLQERFAQITKEEDPLENLGNIDFTADRSVLRGIRLRPKMTKEKEECLQHLRSSLDGTKPSTTPADEYMTKFISDARCYGEMQRSSGKAGTTTGLKKGKIPPGYKSTITAYTYAVRLKASQLK